jgi:hypothetical protein
MFSRGETLEWTDDDSEKKKNAQMLLFPTFARFRFEDIIFFFY